MKLKKIFIAILLVMIFIIVAVIIALQPKKIDYKQSINLDKNTIGINYQLEYVQVDTPPIIRDGQVYIPIDFIKNYVDKYIFFDKVENNIIITNEKNVIRMDTKELEYYINDEPLKLSFPIYNIDDIPYIPKAFLQDLYGLDIKYIKSSNMLSIVEQNYKKAYTKKKTKLKPNLEKREYTKKIQKGDILYYNKDTENEYTKVQTEDGYIGYIKTKFLENSEEININTDYEDDYTTKPSGDYGENITLAFDQMQNVVANASSSRRKLHTGLDVLVPTWFSFANGGGDIVNIADKSYVDFAHKNGYKVWGLLTDNFDSKISHSVLSSSKNREHVIKQLLAFVSIYDLDGINIDFESVPKEDGENFIQFLREFAPLLREEGAILSVDVFVPKPWTKHYRRGEVGKIADYVVVMGYDEHYAGSDSAGSVASINWSIEAIESTLREGVPKEKLILGIPFYTRAWSENTKENKLSSRAYGMNRGYNFIKDMGGEFVWLEDMGQYYGEVKDGDIIHKVWLEDEKSIQKRVELVEKYDIAGVGAWKRGLEKDGIWEVIEKTMNSKNKN